MIESLSSEIEESHFQILHFSPIVPILENKTLEISRENSRCDNDGNK